MANGLFCYIYSNSIGEGKKCSRIQMANLAWDIAIDIIIFPM